MARPVGRRKSCSLLPSDDAFKILDKVAMGATTLDTRNRAGLAGAKIIADEVNARAPYDPDRKEGAHLKGSYRAEIYTKKGPSNAFVKGDYRKNSPNYAPHAHLVEYGTAKAKAKPHFRPAIKTKSGEAQRAIEAELIRTAQEMLGMKFE